MKQIKLRSAFCGALSAVIYGYAPAAPAQPKPTCQW